MQDSSYFGPFYYITAQRDLQALHTFISLFCSLVISTVLMKATR